MPVIIAGEVIVGECDKLMNAPLAASVPLARPKSSTFPVPF